MNELDLLSPIVVDQLHRIRDVAPQNKITPSNVGEMRRITATQSVYGTEDGQLTPSGSGHAAISVCLTIEANLRHLSVSLPKLGTKPSNELLQRIMTETGFVASLADAKTISGILTPAVHVYEQIPTAH